MGRTLLTRVQGAQQHCTRRPWAAQRTRTRQPGHPHRWAPRCSAGPHAHVPLRAHRRREPSAHPLRPATVCGMPAAQAYRPRCARSAGAQAWAARARDRAHAHIWGGGRRAHGPRAHGGPLWESSAGERGQSVSADSDKIALPQILHNDSTRAPRSRRFCSLCDRLEAAERPRRPHCPVDYLLHRPQYIFLCMFARLARTAYRPLEPRRRRGCAVRNRIRHKRRTRV